eukprot:Sspe_Gene.100561::Locus_75246_Transcript_4_5_Confidence_0.222_Length_744::g.100561::m.100561/K06999/K06999; phospholipase/carboxylesterase
MPKGLLFLHGSGDTGPTFRDTLRCVSPDFLRSMEAAGVTVVTPSAPLRRNPAMEDVEMPIWFCRTALSIDGEELEDTIHEMSATLSEILKAKGLHPKDTVIGGFSMGGGMALHHALRKSLNSEQFAGVFALGSFLPTSSKAYEDLVHPTPPLLMCHGDADDLIPFDWGQRTAETLRSKGVGVEFRTAPGLLHEVSKRELDDVAAFALCCLGLRSEE